MRVGEFCEKGGRSGRARRGTSERERARAHPSSSSRESELSPRTRRAICEAERASSARERDEGERATEEKTHTVQPYFMPFSCMYMKGS